MLKGIVRRLFGRTFHDRLFAHELSSERLKRLTKAGIAAVFGKSVCCHQCGQKLAKVFPVIRKGRLEVWGMHMCIVRVEFEDRNVLRFSHVLGENCNFLRKRDGL
jgi:hypothetical protein